jgi:hypothetical protein
MSSSREKRNGSRLVWGVLFLASAAFTILRLSGKITLSLSAYVAIVDEGTRWICVLLFFLMIWIVRHCHWPSKKTENDPPLLKYWLLGFVPFLMIAMSLIVVVDPHARFGGGLFPTMYPSRTAKHELYHHLARIPQVVILGSSRAMRIQPTYIQQTLGYTAFNWALESGESEDFVIALRYMLSRNETLPEAFLIEVTPPLPEGVERVVEHAPIQMLPYLDRDVACMTIEDQLKTPLSFQALSDAVYIPLRLAIFGPTQGVSTFGPEGQFIHDPMLAQTDRNTLLLNDIENIPAPHCQQLDDGGKRNIEEFARIAIEHHSAVIFYVSPRHPTYYSEVMLPDAEYLTCQAALTDYMHTLEQRFDNITFLDFTQLQSINDLGQEGFFDSHHLTLLGSDRLVDAAAQAIRKSIDWASEQRP